MTRSRKSRRRRPASKPAVRGEAALRAAFRKLLDRNLAATLERLRDQNGTIVLNSDDLFMFFPEYANHPERRMVLGPLLYPVAKDFTDKVYAHLLSRSVKTADTVVFTAGGSAAGKSTILRKASQHPGVDFIVDTTFSNEGRALGQVHAALAAGRKVEIYYVFRGFRESVRAMVARALNPKSGRIVPIDDMARTHFGAQRAVLSAIIRFHRERRVTIRLHRNAGSGKLKALSEQKFARHLYRSVDGLQKLGQGVLDELQKVQRQKGANTNRDQDSGRKDLHFSSAFYEAARSQAEKGKPGPRPRDARGLPTRGGESSETRRASA